MNVFAIVTQLAAATSTAPVAQPPGWARIITSAGPLLPIAIGAIFLLMFTNRSKRTQDKARDSMLKQLKRGDRIQTIGGILGTVMRAEESRVEVKVDESSNAKIWFTRSAIHHVVTDDEKADVK